MDAEKSDLIKLYFEFGLSYKNILRCLAHYHGIVISLRHLKRLLRNQNMSRRKHYSDIDSVVGFIEEQLRGSGQLHGYRWMHEKCLQNKLNVRKEDVRFILAEIDRPGVEFRRSRRLSRRSYFAKGPNFIWHLDSYDKLKPFGFGINGCIDGFSRKLIWLNVYHTNSDPAVIGGYFLEALKLIGGCPTLVRCDLGTENVVVRDIQRALNDDTAFIDGPSTANQRIECFWGQLRKECSEFWICIFQDLQNSGVLRGDFLSKNILLFCFTALIQDDLDAMRQVWDAHVIRPTTTLQVPSGRPNSMYYMPMLYETRDYLKSVEMGILDVCEDITLKRSTMPCDVTVYELCITIINQDNLTWPSTASEGVSLFRTLDEKIRSLI